MSSGSTLGEGETNNDIHRPNKSAMEGENWTSKNFMHLDNVSTLGHGRIKSGHLLEYDEAESPETFHEEFLADLNVNGKIQ